VAEHRKKFTDYDQPAVAVDLALMTVSRGVLQVMVMRRRDADRVGGEWALPGGFVHVDVTLEDTVADVLRKKANLQDVYLEQVGTFGALDRDPRGRVISVAYFALTPGARIETAVAERDDLDLMTVRVAWQGEAGGPVELIGSDNRVADLAFDHAMLIGHVVARLRGKLDYTAIGLELLPAKFTLNDVQTIHEAILGRSLSKPPFRRKLLDRGLIVATGEFRSGAAHRPAELYRRKA